MSDTPAFDRTLARTCYGMSDDTLAFLANKMGGNTYTIRNAGGDLSLTDKKGLLSYLKSIEKEASDGLDVAGPVVERPSRTRRGEPLRHNRRVDNVRDPDAAA